MKKKGHPAAEKEPSRHFFGKQEPLSVFLERIPAALPTAQTRTHIEEARAAFWLLWKEAGFPDGVLDPRSFEELLVLDPELAILGGEKTTDKDDREKIRQAVHKHLETQAGNCREPYLSFFRAFREATRFDDIDPTKPLDPQFRKVFNEQADGYIRTRFAVPAVLAEEGNLDSLRNDKRGWPEWINSLLSLLKQQPAFAQAVYRQQEGVASLLNRREYVPLSGALDVLSPHTIEQHLRTFVEKSGKAKIESMKVIEDDALRAAMNADTPLKLQGFCGYLRYLLKNEKDWDQVKHVVTFQALMKNMSCCRPDHIPREILGYLIRSMQSFWNLKGAPKKMPEMYLEDPGYDSSAGPQEFSLHFFRMHLLTKNDLEPFTQIAAAANIPEPEDVVREQMKKFPANLVRLIGQWWAQEGRQLDWDAEIEKMDPEHHKGIKLNLAMNKLLNAWLEPRLAPADRHYLFVTCGGKRQPGAPAPSVNEPLDSHLPLGAKTFLNEMLWYFQTDFHSPTMLTEKVHHDGDFALGLLASKKWSEDQIVLLLESCVQPEQSIRGIERLALLDRVVLGPLLAKDVFARGLHKRIIPAVIEDVIYTQDKIAGVPQDMKEKFIGSEMGAVLHFLEVVGTYKPDLARSLLSEMMQNPAIRIALRYCRNLQRGTPSVGAQLYRSVAGRALYPRIDDLAPEETNPFHPNGPSMTAQETRWVIDRSLLPAHPAMEAVYAKLERTLQDFFHPDPSKRKSQPSFLDRVEWTRLCKQGGQVLAKDDPKYNAAEMLLIAGMSIFDWLEDKSATSEEHQEDMLYLSGCIRYSEPGDAKTIPLGRVWDFLREQETEQKRAQFERQVPVINRRAHIRCTLKLLLGADSSGGNDVDSKTRLQRELDSLKEKGDSEDPGPIGNIGPTTILAPDVSGPPVPKATLRGVLQGTERHLVKSLHGRTDAGTYAFELLPAGVHKTIGHFVEEAFSMAPGEPCEEVEIEYRSVQSGSRIFRPFRSVLKPGSLRCEALPDARIQEHPDRSLEIVSAYETAGSATITFLVPQQKRVAGETPVRDLQKALDSKLQQHLLKSDLTKFNDFPPAMQQVIKEAQQKPTAAEAANHVLRGVNMYYVYDSAIRNSPQYEKFLQERIAEKKTNGDPVLAFVHSFKNDDEKVLGRCMCAHLDYVKTAALRMAGLPAGHYSGYLSPPAPAGTERTVTNHHAHSCAVVFLHDTKGKWMAHPLDFPVPTGASEHALSTSAPFGPPPPEPLHPQTALAEEMLQRHPPAPPESSPSVAAKKEAAALVPAADIPPATIKQDTTDTTSPFDQLAASLEERFSWTPETDTAAILSAAHAIDTLRESGTDPSVELWNQAASINGTPAGARAGWQLMEAYELLFDIRNRRWIEKNADFIKGRLSSSAMMVIGRMVDEAKREWGAGGME